MILGLMLVPHLRKIRYRAIALSDKEEMRSPNLIYFATTNSTDSTPAKSKILGIKSSRLTAIIWTP